MAQSPAVQPRALVEVRTELGNMIVALYNETPVHRDHFLALVNAGSYDSLLFHRVVPGFAVEGGDPKSKRAAPGAFLGQDTDPQGLPSEVVPGLIHRKGALACAPAGDTPEHAGLGHRTRFYFVQGGLYSTEELAQVAARNARLGTPYVYSEADMETYRTIGGLPRLDGSYTVFGEVLEGVEVLDALSRLPSDQWDRPLQDVRMFMRQLR
ncbi:MAG: peptidylprolyl isomerase [Flavobacteriales bacterium]|nr:peptidylprolyl isomerase [Flavobacteriales bacterium]